jgi:hypothetical protein
MPRPRRLLLATLGFSLLVLPGVPAAAQDHHAIKPPTPPPMAVPRARGHVVFVGGYFYDPYFGPYPWWPRVAYPAWYVPRYDVRAQVRIVAEPEAAAVYVDGFYAGIVEDFDGMFERLPLTPGGHEITLYLEGFVTARWRLYLRPGSDITVRAALGPTPPGTPSEPPAVAAPVPAPPDGSYTLPRAPARELSGRESTPPLVPGFGTIVVRVLPVGADVRIDGDTCVSSSPGYVEAYVPPGTHRVEVTLPGHRPFLADLRVLEGRTTTLNVTLPSSS